MSKPPSARARERGAPREAPVRSRWLFDEMFPPACAERLAGLSHDALSVYDLGLAGHGDDEVLADAVGHDHILVTENFGDFSALLDQRLSRGEAGIERPDEADPDETDPDETDRVDQCQTSRSRPPAARCRPTWRARAATGRSREWWWSTT
jgi:hypothetical protein